MTALLTVPACWISTEWSHLTNRFEPSYQRHYSLPSPEDAHTTALLTITACWISTDGSQLVVSQIWGVLVSHCPPTLFSVDHHLFPGRSGGATNIWSTDSPQVFPHIFNTLPCPTVNYSISLIHFLINCHLDGPLFVKISQLSVQVLSLISCTAVQPHLSLDTCQQLFVAILHFFLTLCLGVLVTPNHCTGVKPHRTPVNPYHCHCILPYVILHPISAYSQLIASL